MGRIPKVDVSIPVNDIRPRKLKWNCPVSLLLKTQKRQRLLGMSLKVGV